MLTDQLNLRPEIIDRKILILISERAEYRYELSIGTAQYAVLLHLNFKDLRAK